MTEINAKGLSRRAFFGLGATAAAGAAVAGLTAVGTLMDEDEDTEEKQRRMEAKIAAENLGAVIGFAAGAAMAVKEKLDEQAAREEQK